MAKRKPPLICPSCGNAKLDKIQHVEEILRIRKVTFEDGVLHMGDQSDADEGDEHYFMCRAMRASGVTCDTKIPWPSDIETEWR